jgi:Transglutaminase-like superfamily
MAVGVPRPSRAHSAPRGVPSPARCAPESSRSRRRAPLAAALVGGPVPPARGTRLPSRGLPWPAARARARGLARRIRLGGEVVGAYLQTRRALAHAPIAVVVAEMRGRPTQTTAQTGRERLGGERLGEAHRLAGAVVKTLELLPGDTRCLSRSLVLTRLLERRGIPARLIIGARAGPDFGAHAWVEYDGHPVLPPGDGSFARLVEL